MITVINSYESIKDYIKNGVLTLEAEYKDYDISNLTDTGKRGKLNIHLYHMVSAGTYKDKGASVSITMSLYKTKGANVYTVGTEMRHEEES